MIKIIDMTLSYLDSYNPTPNQLYSLCELLIQSGVNYIEMSINAFNKMGSLPPTGKYILKCESFSQISQYPAFDTYLCRKSGNLNSDNVISEIQVNDIREVFLLNQYANLKNVRIKGLDDFIAHDYTSAFNVIKQTFKGKIQICPQNKYHFATAIATEWIISGGVEVAASFAGIGGFAAIEEVLMTLKLEAKRYSNIKFSAFSKIKTLIEEITKSHIPKNKPIIGEDIFHVEAGIHIDGIAKNPKMYEPFQPEIVGNSRRFILGKHSGKNSIILKLKELGLPVESVDVEILLSKVRNQSIVLQKSLSDEDFIDLYKKSIVYENGGEFK